MQSKATHGWLFFVPYMLKTLWGRSARWLRGMRDYSAGQVTDIDLVIKGSINKKASDVRSKLQPLARKNNFHGEILPTLMRKLIDDEWTEVEIEKVKAYADFYSGANANGYQRVLTKKLAENDYAMLMTACVHCYLADRFEEGAALIDTFQYDKDPLTDQNEYWAYAGYILFAAGRPIQEAIDIFNKAIDAKQITALLAVNAYPIYFEAGEHSRCDELHKSMCSEMPNDHEVTYARATVELARNYYPEGFRLLEARYDMPDLERFMNRSLLNKPRWQGQDLDGKRILIHGEQGFGDLIMMMRYIPFIHRLGAKIVIDGRVEAASLIQRNFPYCEYIATHLQSDISDNFDYWTGSMSLPFHFKTTANTVPSVDGYLTVPEDEKNYWTARISKLQTFHKVKVGIAWSGNPGHRADKRRSIGFDEISAMMKSHPEVMFHSVQTQAPSNAIANLQVFTDEMISLADTAAVISEMDLIITVDTSVVHLAGALGIRTWLLLPYRYEWRWGLEGTKNSWYSTISVKRQKKHGDWNRLLNEVSEELRLYEK